MLHAYSAAENWEKAYAIFQEMETIGIQPDGIACSALMRAFNKGGDPSRIVASSGDINFDTYAILLKNLLSVGSWRKYIEVLQWMVDAGIRPSSQMYLDISSFAQKSGGAEYATFIKQRIELLKRKYGHQDSISKLCDTDSASSLTSRTKVENYKLLESTMAVTYPVSDC
ncbi:hypothetical protein Pyn_28052 [Prunus yedoensis var. nudiflora]|uniref:Pentatricopeptide repeat-containing protein n=1 Tax=Prunus yedoensis var. nudiflora TaxID=2094558 RepID=A0A314ZBN8_PRUYE|nr:hypothetical protein Pyn_28052 [Prunus yedoensis var. nudiflora]